MAITLKDLIDATGDQYHLSLLTARNSLDYVVTWVHMLEDASVTEFFWGNEVAVTGGYTLHGEEAMLQLIDTLHERRCAGLVVNVGQYIHVIPDAVVRRCEELGLPLLTMPWQMYMTEFVRSCCSLINESKREEDVLAETVMRAVQAPQEAGAYHEELEEHFHEENGFQMLAIRVRPVTAVRNPGLLEQRSTLRLHTALRRYDFPYLIFRHEKRFFLLMNMRDPVLAQNAAERILRTIHTALPDTPVYMGLSDPVDSYEELSDCFHGALSAARRAGIQRQELVRFRDMGFYRLLYSVPNDELLRSYYREVMGPLLEHDKRYRTSYAETLLRYLLSDGSLQAVAAAMYTHRNTVNYRMSKIRELLGIEFLTQEERLPYLLAYHIGVILKLNPQWEEE